MLSVGAFRVAGHGYRVLESCLKNTLVDSCLLYIYIESFLLKQWTTIQVSMLFDEVNVRSTWMLWNFVGKFGFTSLFLGSLTQLRIRMHNIEVEFLRRNTVISGVCRRITVWFATVFLHEICYQWITVSSLRFFTSEMFSCYMYRRTTVFWRMVFLLNKFYSKGYNSVVSLPEAALCRLFSSTAAQIRLQLQRLLPSGAPGPPRARGMGARSPVHHQWSGSAQWAPPTLWLFEFPGASARGRPCWISLVFASVETGLRQHRILSRSWRLPVVGLQATTPGSWRNMPESCRASARRYGCPSAAALETCIPGLATGWTPEMRHAGLQVQPIEFEETPPRPWWIPHRGPCCSSRGNMERGLRFRSGIYGCWCSNRRMTVWSWRSMYITSTPVSIHVEK